MAGFLATLLTAGAIGAGSTVLASRGQSQSNFNSSMGNDKKKAKALRSALFETEGGSSGQELSEGQVSQRNTLFGN